MKKYNCPSCAAEVVFQSNISVYAVCKYCNSMIVRRDVDVESIGTMAALPDDMSPLQIGTGGYYNGLRFTIIGRMKMSWYDGAWNEWFLYSDDGRRGWLAEAQGSYGICFELDETMYPNYDEVFDYKNKNSEKQRTLEETLARQKVGYYVTLNNKRFKVVDSKYVICVGSEGELPFAAPKGRKTLTIDLVSCSGEFASIEVMGDKQRIYMGNYVEWDELRCQNFRELEGW